MKIRKSKYLTLKVIKKPYKKCKAFLLKNMLVFLLEGIT